jgi:hypothetical protein
MMRVTGCRLLIPLASGAGGNVSVEGGACGLLGTERPE